MMGPAKYDLHTWEKAIKRSENETLKGRTYYDKVIKRTLLRSCHP